VAADWLAEFEAAARRPLAQRFRYAFVRTYKPVLDDARFRSFESLDEYRRWWPGCHFIDIMMLLMRTIDSNGESP
jgi:hypothetical protein